MTECLNCGSPYGYCDGLCPACHRAKIAAAREARRKRYVARKPPGEKCVHCQIRMAGYGKCGLCVSCYATPVIRFQYPARSHVGVQLGTREPEPTTALPGTAEKVEVLRLRAENKERLWAAGDSRRE